MKIYAHRGLSGYYPENTMAAFENAVKAGADGLELDVHYTADGELVVLHDFELSRTTNGNGFVFNSSLNEMKRLKCRMPGGEFTNETVPLLSEVLELVKDSGVDVYIELKAGSILYKGIEQRVVNMVKHYGLPRDKVLFASFDHEAMAYIKKLSPEYKTGLLTSCRLYEPVSYLKNVGADAYCAQYFTLSPEYVEELVNAGIEVNCYTPNADFDFAMVNSFKKINIVVTNYVEEAKKFFGI